MRLGAGRSLAAPSRSAVCARLFSSRSALQKTKPVNEVPNMRESQRPREYLLPGVGVDCRSNC